MPLFEVQVKQTSTVYYEVEAKTPDAAAASWNRNDFVSEFVEYEDVQAVYNVDDRFEDDDDEEGYDDEPDEDDPAYDG